MKTKSSPNPSLRWKLTWQMSGVVALMVAVFAVGFCLLATMTLSIPPTYGLWDDLQDALDEALVMGPQNQLIIEEKPRLKALKKDNEKLWFVASTLEGAAATYGVVPPEYVELSRNVHLMIDADIREGAGVSASAVIDSADTQIGPVRVMFGGSSYVRVPFLMVLSGMWLVFVPLFAIIFAAVLLSVPAIVRRALAGLSAVVEKAPDIDPRRPGAQLPVKDVPREVVPLIFAFNSILERLEEQFRSRQRFLIDAAHELRTPIAIMQTRIEGLPEGQDQRRLMEDVARLGETAEQLLAFERNDQVNDRRETMDLVETARSVVADLAPLALSAGYDISFDARIAKYEIEGNPVTVPRAISNILRNAIDHGGNRGVIKVSVHDDGEIAISDQGAGIAQDHREKIFEPFYRITPRSTGAGLGLSLVKQIVANHKGRVFVDSNGFGSTFRLRF